ncbi:MAG: hypothetical protein WDN09_01635 [bacterium]
MPPFNDLKDKVHKRLRMRVIIYFVISIVVLGVSIFHILKDGANAFLALVGLLVGIVIGTVVARMYKISWDKNAAQVISKFDAVGVIILVLYVVFEVFRSKIVGYFVHGPSVLAVSFAILAGIMYGRVFGIRGKVRQVFEEEGVA